MMKAVMRPRGIALRRAGPATAPTRTVLPGEDPPSPPVREARYFRSTLMVPPITLPAPETDIAHAERSVISVTPGYTVTAAQLAAIDVAPWGWRTGTVRSVSARLTCVHYDADALPAHAPPSSPFTEPTPVPARVILWHSRDLQGILRPGDIVAVHEQHHALRFVVDNAHDAVRTVSTFVESGVGPVPRPDHG